MLTDFPKRGPALVLVAHPDDEVLWCGGLLLSHPNLDWTVVAACRGSDPDRRPRFEQSCKRLGATGHILDVDDSPDLKPLAIVHDLVDPLEDLLSEQTWHICLTHGKNGEYGHQRHIDVHNAVKSLVEDERLSCSRFWTFAYTADETMALSPDPKASISIELEESNYQQKQALIRDVYGFQAGSFEMNACLSTESFCQIPIL